MRLKKSKPTRNERCVFRCSEQEKNAIQRKANIYSDGNLSEYILFASLNFVPSKEDFEEDQDKPKKKKK